VAGNTRGTGLSAAWIEILKARYLAASAIITAAGDAAIHIIFSHMFSAVLRYSVSIGLGFLICSVFSIPHLKDVHRLSRDWKVVLVWLLLSASIGLLVYGLFEMLVIMGIL
jgi:hypothetical protein